MTPKGARLSQQQDIIMHLPAVTARGDGLATCVVALTTRGASAAEAGFAALLDRQREQRGLSRNPARAHAAHVPLPLPHMER